MKNPTQSHDPAITALAELRVSEAALTETERLVDSGNLDYEAPEVEAVRKEDIAALDQFTETEPTTIQGAIVKLQYFADESGSGRDALNARAVIAFLERPLAVPTLQSDPAVIAGKKAAEAAAVLEAVGVRDLANKDLKDDSPEYNAADELYSVAADKFLKATPSTPAGAIAKLREVIDCDFDKQPELSSPRHLRSVIAYLKKAIGSDFHNAVETQTSDPLSDLWAEWESLENKMGSTPEGKDIPQALHDSQGAVEDKMAETKPVSLGGALAMARLLQQQFYSASPDETIGSMGCKNLIAGLEGMGSGIQPSATTNAAPAADMVDSLPQQADGNLSEIGRELERLYAIGTDTDRMEFLEDQIRDLPANTLEGVNVKLRRLRRYAQEMEWDDHHERLLSSILEGVAALGRLAVASILEPDPAVIAGKEAAEAAAVLEAANEDVAGEYEAAEVLYSAASGKFLEATPTTPAGAIAKLQDVLDRDYDSPDDKDLASPHHIRNVIAYLEKAAGAPATHYAYRVP